MDLDYLLILGSPNYDNAFKSCFILLIQPNLNSLLLKNNKVGNKPIVKTITKIGAVFQTISQQGKQENFIHQ
jgi:hypothetical protein